jgi:hypothetical protein
MGPLHPDVGDAEVLDLFEKRHETPSAVTPRLKES